MAEVARREARPTAVIREADPAGGAEVLGRILDIAMCDLGPSSMLEMLAVLAEESRDVGLASAVAAHSFLATEIVRRYGTDEQSGRLAVPGRITALCADQAQPGAKGSVLAIPPRKPGGQWTLDGQLDMVIGGVYASHLLLSAESGCGRRGWFWLDLTSPGAKVKGSGPAGLATCGWAQIRLTECTATDDDLIDNAKAEDDLIQPRLSILNWVAAAATWLGVTRALSSKLKSVLQHKQLFGAPLAHSQSARFGVAECAIRTALLEQLVNRAGALLDADQLTVDQAATLALATQATTRTVSDIAWRFAGSVPDHEEFVSRACRDAWHIASIGGGLDVVQPIVAAGLLADAEGKSRLAL